MKIRPFPRPLLMAVAAWAAMPYAQAIELKDAVQQTLVSSPVVKQKLHQFYSASAETGVGRAGFFPVADISYTDGRELAPKDKQQKASIFQSSSPTTLDRWGWSVNVSQNLFNGYQTVSMMRQLDHAQRALYYQFLDISAQQALEASQAYLDVLRNRQLVEVANANFQRHQEIYRQIEQKVGGNVARGVDLEQAAGRLALAETNLLTSQGNLDDVEARFTRIVGKAPPPQMQALPALEWNPPGNDEAVSLLLNAHPSNRAAREGVEAARSARDGRRGAFMPTLDARARQEWGSGVPGSRTGAYDRKVFEVVTSFNLSRGGADKARLSMAAQALNVALDQRELNCRETRQSLSMTTLDYAKQQRKITYLRHHALSSEKVRDAYHNQFLIAQRTLLDVLDSENEFFTAQRAAINGDSDLALARLRGAAASGQLLTLLGVQPSDSREFEAPPAGGPSCSEAVSS